MQPHPDRHPTAHKPVARLAAMPFLFARYVAGQIEDPFWDQFMQVLDANETLPEERLALAAFLNDAFAELEPDEVKVPKSSEVQEIFSELHTQAGIKH